MANLMVPSQPINNNKNHIVMKKYIYIIAFACVALSAAAGDTMINRFNISASALHGQVMVDGLRGYRIAAVEVRDVDWNESTGLAVVGETPYNLGWKTWLSPAEDNATLVAKDFYEGMDLPIAVNYDNGQVWLVAGDSITAKTETRQQGNYTIETIKCMYVLPAAWLVDIEAELASDIKGTIYADGSIHIDDDFAILIYQEVTKKDHRGNVVSSDNAYLLSPVMCDVSFLVPNGVHEYNVVTDRQTVAQLYNNLETRPDEGGYGYGVKAAKPFSPQPKVYAPSVSEARERHSFNGHGGRVHTSIDPVRPGGGTKGTGKGLMLDTPTSMMAQMEDQPTNPADPTDDGSMDQNPANSSEMDDNSTQASPSSRLKALVVGRVEEPDKPLDPLGHGGRIHNPIDPRPGSSGRLPGYVIAPESQPGENYSVMMEILGVEDLKKDSMRYDPSGHGGRTHNPIDPRPGNNGRLPGFVITPDNPQPGRIGSNKPIHVDPERLREDVNVLDPLGHGGRVHNPIDPRPGSSGRLPGYVIAPGPQPGNGSVMSPVRMKVDGGSGVVDPLGHGGRIHNPLDPRLNGKDASSVARKSNGNLASCPPLNGNNASIDYTPGIQPGVEHFEEPIYIFQSPQDGAIYVYNLYGCGLIQNYMEVKADGSLSFPCQVIGYSDSSSGDVFNCQSELAADLAIELGNTGRVTDDCITWGITIPYCVNDVLVYYYSDNKVSYTSGERFVVAPVTIKGDANSDGVLSIADVSALIDRLLGQQQGESINWNSIAVDVNGDNTCTISDVTALIDLLLNQAQ